MAEAKLSQTLDEFCCSVCLEVLKDPVTTSCGHSFCMVCINKCWDQEDNKGTFSCPQCRRIFTTRPELNKNIIIAEVVEKLKKESKVSLPAGPEDVECDFCTGRKHKAVKSCLVCLVSYCEIHLQPHYEGPAFKKHKLVEASRRLQDQICSQHDKLLEVYCRTDHKCICMLCTMDDHKGHDITSTAAERTQKQKQLLEIQKKIQTREKELNDLIIAVETHKSSAETEVENIERIRTELNDYINRKCSEVKEQIRNREKVLVSRAEDEMKRLKQLIVDVKNKEAELKHLSHTEDHVHFLQSFQSLSPPAGAAESDVVTITSFLSFDEVTKSVSQLREKIEELWEEHCEKIPGEVIKVQILSRPEPETRDDFLQYFCRFSLDPNTVNNTLHLSEENKVVTCNRTVEWYPDHPDRFNNHQVLCSESVCESVSESVCGRCYWEVEWTGLGVLISVSYKNINRKGNGSDCRFGCNTQSWSLLCSPSRFSFWHNNTETKLPIMPSSCRIGVYVDYRAGILSFYNVSDTMKLLHTVQTEFSQLLYPGFNIWQGSTVKLSDLTQI